MKFLTTFYLCFLSLTTFASDIELVWRRIDTQYIYKDADKQCTTKTSVGNSHIAGEAYLALEVEGGKVSGARFSNYPNIFPYKWIYKAIDLEPNEIASIELVLDKNKQIWVKSFTLTERLAKWLVYFPSQRHYWCEIPFTPKNISPKTQTLVFETEGIEQGIEVSYGDWIKLEGERPDGVHFEETIRLVQRKED